MSTTAVFASQRKPETPLTLLVLHGLLYTVGTWLYLRILATPPAQIASIGVIAAALLAARVAHRHRVRILATAIASGLLVALGYLTSRLLRYSEAGFGVTTTLLVADVVYICAVLFAMVLMLRMLAARWHALSLLEVAFIVGAVAYTLAGHRNRAFNQPRFLTDWAWSRGIDPRDIIVMVGVVTSTASLILLVRTRKLLKVLTTFVILILAGAIFYVADLFEFPEPEPPVDTNGLGLTKGEEGDKGNPLDGGGDGSGENLFDGEGGGNAPPDIIVPVAVAIFHDDFEPPDGIYYFRQQVLSRYNGHHLVASLGDRDQDVITEFPTDDTLHAEPTQNPDFHVRVPASMYLLSDHPQPFALTGSIEISPIENPQPRHFVSAYGAVSLSMTTDASRLLGRASIPDDWPEHIRAHYLEIPDDPRYAALGEKLARDVDPRFVGDDMMRALAIKRYLEKEGFYTRKEKHEDEVDPAASFLFGSMRGYCVHFAHAAVYLFRSQGIAARVALGYAVSNEMRTNNGTVMILNDRAHAWPEIHIAGVGWIPFDIYPERSDEPPPKPVDQSLESLLSELARGDETGGMAADPNEEPLRVPWNMIGWVTLSLLGWVIMMAYGVKAGRRLVPVVSPQAHRWVFMSTLDRFSDLGLPRRFGETRERYAERLASVAPSMRALTRAHLRLAFVGPSRETLDELRTLRTRVHRELVASIPFWRRLLAWLNPIGWLYTR